MTFGKLMGIIVGSLLYALGMAIIMALPVMLIWDAIVPSIFGLRKIDFLESVGLLLLTGFLFRARAKFSFDLEDKQ